MQLNENIILITGGSSGIGFELVKRFYALNNKIIVVARNKEKLLALEREFLGIVTFQADLTKQSELDGLIVFIEQNYTDLNILINNAGIQYNFNFLTEPNFINRIDYEISANLMATIKLCALLLPTILKNKNAAIVNISSGLALTPKKSAPVYCATKAGIHNFTKALRYQLETTVIKVFEILPSVVDTPMTEGRGKNKITAKQLVDEFIANFKRDKFESYIGKTKVLKFLCRLSPKIANKILKNG